MLSSLTSFQDYFTKVVVDRLTQKWIEGDVQIITKGSEIVLENITLKEIPVKGPFVLGGWCQRAVLEVDWSGLWRYWQVNSAPAKHSLKLHQLDLIVTRRQAWSDEDEEYFDAVSWDSLEELEQEFKQIHGGEQRSLFGDWIDGVLGQVQLEFNGFTVELEGFEGRIGHAVIESVCDGLRRIEVAGVAVWQGEKQIAKTHSITGQMEGNQIESVKLKCESISGEYEKHAGNVKDIEASFRSLSAATIEIVDLAVISKVTFTDNELVIEQVSYLGPQVESPDALADSFSFDNIPDFVKQVQVSVLSGSWKDVRLEGFKGKWPRFQLEHAHGNRFDARGLQCHIDPNQPQSFELLCTQQTRFIDNIQLNIISQNIPEANLQISIQSLSLRFEDESDSKAKQLTVNPSFSISVSVKQIQVNTSKFDCTLNDAIIIVLPDASVYLKVKSCRAVDSADRYRLLDASLHAVIIENSVSLEVHRLTAEMSMDPSTSTLTQNNISIDELLSLPVEISSIHLNHSKLSVKHPQLPQSPSLTCSSLIVFPPKSVVFIENLRAETEALQVQSGAIKLSRPAVDCDEVEVRVIDVGEATTLLQSLQDLFNPPVPVSEPIIRWKDESIVGLDEDENGDEDDDEDENGDEDDSFNDDVSDKDVLVPEASEPHDETSAGFTNPSITADNLDLEALEDALQSTLLPGSQPADKQPDLSIKIKSFVISCDPFKTSCSVKFCLLLQQPGSFELTLDALSVLHHRQQILSKWSRGPLKDSTSFGSSFSDAAFLVDQREDGEYVMQISQCPLRIKLDSSILSDLLVLLKAVESSPPSSRSDPQRMVTPVAFFSSIRVPPVAIKLDFAPTLQGAHLLLPGSTLTGVTGLSGLTTALHRLWLPSLHSRSQVNRMLRSGLTPVRMSVRVSQGVVELILLPGAVSQRSAARAADEARAAAMKVAKEVLRGGAEVVGKLILVMVGAGAEPGEGGEVRMTRPVAIINEGLQLLTEWE